MFTKTILPVFTFLCLLICSAGNVQASSVIKTARIFPDTFPSINTIAEADIDTVRDRIKTNTIDVKLKNGAIYSYNADKVRSQWENKAGLPSKIEKVINDWRKTFTRVEHPPVFPGGDEAWDAYIKKYIEENKALLKHKGSGQVYVQFIVDTDGELSGIEALQNQHTQLSRMAVDAVEKGPFWLPAMQNGRKVVAYQKVIVKF